MDRKNLSDDQQKNIDSILEQLKSSLTLPPSESFLEAAEFSLENFVERNVWHIFISIDSVLFNLMEFSKRPGVVNEYKEMWRSQLFAKLFLKKYRIQYLLFSENFIRDREKYINNTPSNDGPPSIEINEDAHHLFDLSATIATNIFKSKVIQGEHLILSFFSPHFYQVQEFFRQEGVDVEELLCEWVQSMNLSVKELVGWQSAFNFIECKVDVSSLIEERQRQDEKNEASASEPLEEATKTLSDEWEEDVEIIGKAKEKTLDEVGSIDNVEDFDSLVEEGKGTKGKKAVGEKPPKTNIETTGPANQVITSALEQLVKRWPLPPSDFVRKILKFAIQDALKRNVWPLPISLHFVFFSFMEFYRVSDKNSDSEEMRRGVLFAGSFLAMSQNRYSSFYESYIKNQDYQSPPKDINMFSKITIELEIFEEVQSLLNKAGYLAGEVFGVGTIQSEHLILSFLSPNADLENVFKEMGVIKEELLYKWLKFIDFSVEELELWDRALQYVGCEVDMERVVKEKETEYLAQKEKNKKGS